MPASIAALTVVFKKFPEYVAALVHMIDSVSAAPIRQQWSGTLTIRYVYCTEKL